MLTTTSLNNGIRVMTDTVCNALMRSCDGAISAQSCPTGMRNNGPEEYLVRYDPDQTTYDTVAHHLRLAINHSITHAYHLSTERVDPTGNCGTAAMDGVTEDYPLVNASVHIHENAVELQEVSETIRDELLFWGIEWSVYPTEVDGSQDTHSDSDDHLPHDSQLSNTGVLEICFQLEDDSRYDAVVKMIHDTVSPNMVEVAQADSDGYYLLVTQNVAETDSDN